MALQRIFFPWERGGGLMRRLRLHRIRPFVFALLMIAGVTFVGLRERKQSGIRHTRATLLDVRFAMDAYMAEHDGECPETLESLTAYGSFKSAPRDAWGRSFRFACPGRRVDSTYDIWSDGPDGEPGGLDRIE